MSSDIIKDILQCVNCGIKLNQVRRQWVAEQSKEIRELLTDWICKELEIDEAVCCPCYSLLHLALESENKARRLGHKTVCLSCGLSLNQAKKSPSLSAHPEYKLVITQWIQPHQVKGLEFVCRRCFTKAKRWYKKNNIGKHSNDSEEEIQIKVEELGYGELDIPASSDSQESSDEEEKIPDKDLQPYSISLNTYKRAADSASCCAFKTCRYTDRTTPPRSIKERLLLDYSFYLPPHARLCKQHQINSHEVWREFVDSTTITDFTAAHIENMLSILKNTKCKFFCRSFVAHLKQDDYLCQYFLGIKFEKYEEMLKDIEPIRKRVWGVQKALAMYLMKKHTGFSAEKVANFFGLRLKVLMKIIHRVRVHLETVAAADDSYVAVPTVGADNQEDIVYHKA